MEGLGWAWMCFGLNFKKSALLGFVFEKNRSCVGSKQSIKRFAKTRFTAHAEKYSRFTIQFPIKILFKNTIHNSAAQETRFMKKIHNSRAPEKSIQNHYSQFESPKNAIQVQWIVNSKSWKVNLIQLLCYYQSIRKFKETRFRFAIHNSCLKIFAIQIHDSMLQKNAIQNHDSQFGCSKKHDSESQFTIRGTEKTRFKFNESWKMNLIQMLCNKLQWSWAITVWLIVIFIYNGWVWRVPSCIHTMYKGTVIAVFLYNGRILLVPWRTIIDKPHCMSFKEE